ncbi:MAG: hypothetical protein WEA29_09590 [Acidimicrobiia bacterium]
MPFAYPTRSDLESLVDEASYPLVSIVIPTKRVSTGEAERIALKNAIREATERLSEEDLEREAMATLTERLAAVQSSIDFTMLTEGLAVFVSETDTTVFHLSFEPLPAVTVDSTYLLKPVIRQVNREQPYYLLALSEQHTRLWTGVRDRLEEIRGDGFPAVHEGVGGEIGAPTGFGKRTSHLRDEGHRKFFREVVADFQSRLAQDSRPVVVAGVRRYHDFLGEIGGLGADIVGEILGNVDKVPEKDLGAQAWVAIEERQAAERDSWVEAAETAAGGGEAVRGLDDIYQSALAGRVRLLVAESTYVVAATIDDSGHIHVDAPETGVGPGHADDAVDFIAAEVLRKGGDVRYVDDGTLSDLGRAVGILRY